jgi:sec-independent protein translocase protein TatB
MFDISWGKLVIIGVVALIVIGPKELPSVLRMIGQWMGKIRRMAGEFQGQFQEAMREAEMADLKKQFDETTSSLNSALDPSGFKTDIEKMIQDPMGLDAASATSTPATPPSDPTAPVATPATATGETTPPSDPVALGTAPVAPVTDIAVPMPDLPPPPESKDFADVAASPQVAAPQVAAPQAAAPHAAEPAAPSPVPVPEAGGGKAA